MWHTQTKIHSLCCTCMHIVSHTNLDGNAQIWNKTLVEWPGDLLLNYNLMGVFNKYLNNVEIYSSGSYTNFVFCFACTFFLQPLYSMLPLFWLCMHVFEGDRGKRRRRISLVDAMWLRIRWKVNVLWVHCVAWRVHLEWMNEWCIYIVLYCVLLYTQSALQSCGGGGSLLNHHQCAASTWMMRRLPQDNEDRQDRLN